MHCYDRRMFFLIKDIECKNFVLLHEGCGVYSQIILRNAYKLEFELKNLPSKIDNIEKEINTLSNQLSDPDFYLNDPDGFLLASENLAIARSELEKYELRWLELEELKTD